LQTRARAEKERRRRLDEVGRQAEEATDASRLLTLYGRLEDLSVSDRPSVPPRGLDEAQDLVELYQEGP
jgi:hypothetical protein